MTELPPKIDKKTLLNAVMMDVDADLVPIINKINTDYEYWDKVKYKPLPKGYTPEMLWT